MALNNKHQVEMMAEPLAKPVTTEEAERLMKRCQRGVGGRGALDEAHSIMADCYGTIGALVRERDMLRRGECICRKCGLRQDGGIATEHAF